MSQLRDGLQEQLNLLPQYLTAHLQLALMALALGALVSIPLGIWVVRHPRLETALLGLASVIQTVPSLALLAIMVPLLSALNHVTQAHLGFEVHNIGFTPALIALTLYSMLPILRNAVTGLQGVDPALTEAARGVGMTAWQRLWRVELPQALPTMVAGMRTATTWVVSMTVLSTPVGAPSLGNYIFTGLQTRNPAAILVGCGSAAALALVLDAIIRALEVGAQTGRRRRTGGALALLALLYLFVGQSLYAQSRQPAHAEIRIGAKTFTEQYILAEILAQQLRARAASPRVRVVQSLGSNVAYEALKSGAIDAYVEYSGTVFTTLMKRQDTLPRLQLTEAVRNYLGQNGGVTVAATLGFANSYTLAMPRKAAQRQRIVDLTTLADAAPTLRLAGDYEFFSRPEWRNLQRIYGLAFAEQRSMDPALIYDAVASGSVDLVAAYSSEGRLAALDLLLLEDTQGAIAPYDALVLVGPSLRHNQAAVVALSELDNAIDLETMQRLNYAVDHDHKSPAEVAAAWLRSRPAASDKH
jgi:osmoprotectant transport system permease protein